MTRVNALKAYKEPVYDQWYRDVSVSRARSGAGRGQERRHSLTVGGIRAEQAAIHAGASRSLRNSLRRLGSGSFAFVTDSPPWTATFYLCCSGKP